MTKFFFLGLTLALWAGGPAFAVTNTLIATGSVWKYLDDGSDQATAWVAPEFDDSLWLAGPGQLGYGDDDEATVLGFGPDANNKYITSYFRHAFDVSDPGIYAVLILSLRRDDGVIVYLNGAEIYRNNMPGGPVTFSTVSSTSASDDGNAILTSTVSPSLLVEGNNVLAAEIHQQSLNSSDISFDLELLGSTELAANNPPTVIVSNPGNNAFFTAPADILVAASDSDGTISRVEFFEGNAKLGEATSAPFNFPWNSVPIGNYTLRAVATDNLNAKATSAVVNVTVAVATAPTLASVSPAPGNVSQLSQIAVRFSEPVSGVDAADLLINGQAAAGLAGSGANYTFTFSPPRDGIVRVAWQGRHGIVDFENPPKPFDPYGAGATWQYTLADTVAPAIAQLQPASGATLRSLRTIEVTFNEPVWGVDASDLRVNGVAAVRVTGSGNGPYAFEFVQPTGTAVTASWASGHGIRDFAGTANGFGGGTWSYSLNTNALFEGQVVINEIMYHPASGRTEDEWLELYNRGPGTVNLTGWSLTRGADFTFPNTTLAAGGYLVVAADMPAFAAKYPAVANVVGGWTGRLDNGYEDVELEDAQGQRVDLVSYADQGDFAIRTEVLGWDWASGADGLGGSLELRQPALENNTGQNWQSSLVTDGTPGRANSVATTDLAPLIVETAHFPAIPRSTNAVTVTARIVDEQPGAVTVRLWYRDVTTTSPGNFTTVTMTDNGQNNDGVAGDGIFGARLSAMANRTIIEFYVQATDAANQTRTWPAPALQGGSPVQAANALFQVDDEVYTGSQAIYRLILTASDRNGFLGQADRVQRNATLITVEGDDAQVRHNCDVRRRGASSFGASPPTMKLNVPTDRPWHGKSSINLNSVFSWAQVIGSAVCLKAGLPAANARAVQVRFNGVNESQGGNQQFGSYAHVEVLNDEWAQDHFPNDAAGNLYSKRRPECGLVYQGANIQSYINCAYDKESNRSENDWTDLMSLTFALDPATTPDADYVRAVRQNANVELWMRYFAVLFLLNYNETALGTGADDDYDLYRGVVDPRFMVLVHDLDSVFGSAGGSPNDLFLAARIPVVSRFLRHPEFEPLYYAEYRRLLTGAFATNHLFPLFEQVLSDWVPAGTIQGMRNDALGRINHALSVLPPAPTVVRATVSGQPPATTYLNAASLTVGGPGVTHYRYRLNGGGFGPETPVSTPITLAGLADGTYTVYAIGRDGSGTWQAETSPTISSSWTVLSGLRRVILNEVLARNDSIDHEGTFPDLIELFNAGATTTDLTGLRLTDDLNAPDKFVFGPGSTLAAGGYLVLIANNPDATPGIHIGFSLDQNGETLYLLDRATNGGRVLDSVEFGLQLPDLSVGRLADGRWNLAQPTFGTANLAAATASPNGLKINEWLANGVAPFLDDFVELYNPDPLPVALGGLFLTDQPIGSPFRHPLTPLSFIEGYGYRAFLADGQGEAGADHLGFQLALEWGEIALLDANGTILDAVTYGQQQAGISQGRAPNGGTRITALRQPTPGVGNPVPPAVVPPQVVGLVSYSHVWKYDESGTDLGIGWSATSFDDAAWLAGPGLVAAVRPGGVLPEPVGTSLTVGGNKPAFYFRTQFSVTNLAQLSGVQLTHIFDDGAVVYLNGVEVYRYNMPAGPVSFGTLASGNILDATYQGPILLPLTQVRTGVNHLAVEMHQAALSSADIVLGCKLDGVILTNNPGLAGILLNEILANPRNLTNSDGTVTDWVELHNPSNASVDLSGMSLTDRLSAPRRWVFPQGSIIPATGYRIVRLDPDSPASSNLVTALNTGFGLNASGDAVYLFNRPASGGELLDALTFGLQAPDWSIGRVPNGGANWVLTLPTAGAANIAAALGNPAQLQINEWMADPAGGDDWFELHNPSAQPVALAGLHLTDDLSDRFKHVIAPLSFIASGLLGFQRFEADNAPTNGADHVNFRLDADGESLALSDAYGAFINSLTFGAQARGVSQGRLSDGTTNIVSFPETLSPGESNYRPIPDVVINEVLTHTDPPFEDAIELRNTSTVPVNIGGWYLSDARTFLTKFRIPDGTTIPAHGFRVFYENQFNPRPGDPDSFALSSAQGDQLYLSAAAGGVLTGYRAVVEFGAAERGVPFGRFATSMGFEFVALNSRSFGQDDPDTLEQFRSGTGRTNSYAKVGPLVISEIMYHPPDLDTNDNVGSEYIQLRNLSANSVDLFDPDHPTNRWRLRDAVRFDFPAHTTLPPNGTVLLVSFDPVTNALARAQFLSRYGLPGTATLLGPYEGKLDNSSDSIELYKPDEPQPLGSSDPGSVPYVLVERVVYSDAPPWPTPPDGTGLALHRVDPSLFGNDPANWTAATPLSSPADRDSDGMPDDWESQYGLDPDSSADATQDRDQDGLNNYQEYLAGTDPTDAASGLELRLVSLSPVTLEFSAVANKSYSIEFRNDLTFGAWVPLTHIDPAAGPRIVQFSDTPFTTRFYRLRSPRAQ